ncbi:endonuclease/exonuclease/phosphatase family protein [Flagellimonas pelagia]|uniref:Endonuclease/exonuclease/phosphatase family protein n=1 Tax=Flagellimonas pelagia TaxID=2306998 RepID=A0A3A1NGZ6_9FLAO|nr:endonuclease/exonuclease/phosphatase family protein [Allomuricauda maritima]RIV42231.1 endonuclease/exonuclease/phosphatase family protein [Allomuricauda maritima]TXJ91121.1 endonuclease/exonuclease/phosphatase family protein [Allomuricauda maritima]
MKTLLFTLLLFTAMVGVNGQTIDVITYNIRYDNPNDKPNNWDNRKAFLISQLQFYAPDVFGTQEGLVHQLKDIDEGLEDYTYVGIGRDHGDDRGEFSALFYNTKKLKVLKQSTFWLSETPDVPSKGWDAALPRICTYGLFENKADGSKFMVFNTHFDHVGVTARAESSKLILKKMKELNPDGLPVILTGDFNLESDSSGVQVILGEMTDTHVAMGKNAFGPNGTFNGFEFNKPVERRIDYIFVSPNNVEVLKSAILSDSKDCRYPSDHLPVFARLRLVAP